MFDGYDEEGAAAGTLGDDGDEFGVYGAEVAVVRILSDLDALVALALARGAAEHVAELAAPHASEARLRPRARAFSREGAPPQLATQQL